MNFWNWNFICLLSLLRGEKIFRWNGIFDRVLSDILSFYLLCLSWKYKDTLTSVPFLSLFFFCQDFVLLCAVKGSCIWRKFQQTDMHVFFISSEVCCEMNLKLTRLFVNASPDLFPRFLPLFSVSLSSQTPSPPPPPLPPFLCKPTDESAITFHFLILYFPLFRKSFPFFNALPSLPFSRCPSLFQPLSILLLRHGFEPSPPVSLRLSLLKQRFLLPNITTAVLYYGPVVRTSPRCHPRSIM